MCKDLEEGYVPTCLECQCYKSRTVRPVGPLHPLPVPDERCKSVTMDFIGPLPVDEGYNCLLIITDRLNSDYCFIPTTTDATTEQTALLFFNQWYCENGLPLTIISDCDKLFTSHFWAHLCLLTGIDHKCSSAYHPETDGASERTNKTVIQMLRFHVERNQTGWVRALPRIRFQIMNSVNKSTKSTPFQLQFGRTPRILPPLTTTHPSVSQEATSARKIIDRIQIDVADAKDNLLLAKITQSAQTNKHRTDSFPYKVGNWVWINTDNHRCEFKDNTKGRTAKSMPCYDSPFSITTINPQASTITIRWPTNSCLCPTFHIHHAKPYHENNNLQYPTHHSDSPTPPPALMNEEVDYLVNHKC